MPVLPEEMAKRCAMEIADRLVPKFRVTGTARCHSNTGYLWQAVWDGAMEAYGYDSSNYRGVPPTLHSEQ